MSPVPHMRSYEVMELHFHGILLCGQFSSFRSDGIYLLLFRKFIYLQECIKNKKSVLWTPNCNFEVNFLSRHENIFECLLKSMWSYGLKKVWTCSKCSSYQGTSLGNLHEENLHFACGLLKSFRSNNLSGTPTSHIRQLSNPSCCCTVHQRHVSSLVARIFRRWNMQSLFLSQLAFSSCHWLFVDTTVVIIWVNSGGKTWEGKLINNVKWMLAGVV